MHDATMTKENQPTTIRPPEWVPVVDPVERLRADVLAVRPRGIIRIFCGEADPCIYNNNRFLNAVRSVTDDDEPADIAVMTGPILLIDDGGNNALLQLQQCRRVRLFHRLTRGDATHFRVVEVGDAAYRFYREFRHKPLATKDQRLELNPTAFPPWELHAEAVASLALFDSWLHVIADQSKAQSASLPLLATKAGLAYLLSEAQRRELDFNSLAPNQLRDLQNGKDLLFRSPL